MKADPWFYGMWFWLGLFLGVLVCGAFKVVRDPIASPPLWWLAIPADVPFGWLIMRLAFKVFL